MPKWICPSPLLADLSFPHSAIELEYMESALLDLVERLEAGEAVLVLTPMMGLMLSEVDYSCSPAQVAHISGLLYSLIMDKGSHVVWFDADSVGSGTHPGVACCDQGNIALWLQSAQSISEALRLADAPVGAIGVMCARASAGADICESWAASDSWLRLVSTRNLETLGCAYFYEYDAGVLSRPCALDAVRHHYGLLGATGIEKRISGGSHVEVLVFPGGRPWPIDLNDDPIPDNNLRSLARCSGLPAQYVRTVLNTGMRPARRPWLSVAGVAEVRLPAGAA